MVGLQVRTRDLAHLLWTRSRRIVIFLPLRCSRLGLVRCLHGLMLRALDLLAGGHQCPRTCRPVPAKSSQDVFRLLHTSPSTLTMRLYCRKTESQARSLLRRPKIPASLERIYTPSTQLSTTPSPPQAKLSCLLTLLSHRILPESGLLIQQDAKYFH